MRRICGKRNVARSSTRGRTGRLLPRVFHCPRCRRPPHLRRREGGWRRSPLGWVERKRQKVEKIFLGLRDGGGWRRRRRHLRFNAAPSDRASPDSFPEGAEQYHIQHLAVIEALEDERRQKRPVLSLFERKGHHASEKIDHH